MSGRPMSSSGNGFWVLAPPENGDMARCCVRHSLPLYVQVVPGPLVIVQSVLSKEKMYTCDDDRTAMVSCPKPSACECGRPAMLLRLQQRPSIGFVCASMRSSLATTASSRIIPS